MIHADLAQCVILADIKLMKFTEDMQIFTAEQAIFEQEALRSWMEEKRKELFEKATQVYASA